MSSRVINQLIRVSSCFLEYSILIRFTRGVTASRSLPSTVGRSSRTFSLYGPKSRCSSTPTREFYHPQSSRETSLTGLGKSSFVASRALWALLVQQEARTPNGDVNVNASSLGLIPIGISQPVKSIPSAPTTRVPKRRWCANAPPGLYCALGPTLPRQPRHLADREFAAPISCPWKPRMPGFRYSGFGPPVRTRINGLDQFRESPFAISNGHGIHTSPTLICRCARGIVPSRVYGLNLPQLLSDPTILRIS